MSVEIAINTCKWDRKSTWIALIKQAAIDKVKIKSWVQILRVK